MALCFPSTPPGYERERVRLIDDSIKLQEEERLENENRKERMQEKKSLESCKVKEKKESGHDKRHKDDVHKLDSRMDMKPTATTEQLEESGLSEEHGKPARLCTGDGRSGDSSDSSQNSNLKRKKPEPPANIIQQSCSHLIHGNVCLQQPQETHKDLGAPRSECDPSCSHSYGELNAAVVAPSTLAVEQHLLTLEQAAERHIQHRCHNSSIERDKQLFRDLIVNWTPPEFIADLRDLLDENLEWLMDKKEKQQCEPVAKRIRLTTDGGLCREAASLTVQPRARYLHEVNIFALPYVLPF